MLQGPEDTKTHAREAQPQPQEEPSLNHTSVDYSFSHTHSPPVILQAIPVDSHFFQHSNYTQSQYGQQMPGVHIGNGSAAPIMKKEKAYSVGGHSIVGIIILICCIICCCICLFGGLLGGLLNRGRCMHPLHEEVRYGDNYISLIYVSCTTQPVVDAFEDAANRWSSVIKSSRITPSLINFDQAGCPLDSSYRFYNDDKPVDRLIIYVEVIEIDNIGGILAQATPCYVDASERFPIVGMMQFDTTDLDFLDQLGTVEAVVTHEMGHVLGIGTLWNFNNNHLLRDPIFTYDESTGEIINIEQNNSPRFVGENAMNEYQKYGGRYPNPSKRGVPVEDGRNKQNYYFDLDNGEGTGSVDSHWDYEVFINELMVFQIDPKDYDHPLSRVTIGSLEDLGYSVDYSKADSYLLPERPNGQINKGLQRVNLRGIDKDLFNEDGKLVLKNDVKRYRAPGNRWPAAPKYIPDAE